MKHTKEAISNIKRLGKQLEGLIEFSKELENVDSLDNHIQELTKKKDALLKDVFEVEVKKEKVAAELAEAVSKAESEFKDSKAKLDLAVSEMADKIVVMEKEALEKQKASDESISIKLEKAEEKLNLIQKQVEVEEMKLKQAEDKLALVTKELERIKSL